jgi:hypothetical protein
MQKKSAPVYLSLPADHCFDHVFLSDKLASYRSTRDKISLMLRRGEIIKLRRGLYARSRGYGGLVEPMNAANIIYGPSYISLEYALSYHGLIPERVETITSVTPKVTKEFNNPLGAFSYRHIPAKAYPAGIDFVKSGNSGMLIATPEKALCDRLALTPNIRTMSDVGDYFIENLRIEEDSMASLSVNSLGEIQRAYGLHCIELFVKWHRKLAQRRPSG